MQENEFQSELRSKRHKIIEEIESLLQQLKACDTVLDATSSTKRLHSVEPGFQPSAESSPASDPSAQAIVIPPKADRALAATDSASFATPVPRRLSERELAQFTTLADSGNHGSLMARVELAIADCGDTFALPDVLKAFKPKPSEGKGHVREIVGSALWKLGRRGRYHTLKRGTGTTPTLYGK